MVFGNRLLYWWKGWFEMYYLFHSCAVCLSRSLEPNMENQIETINKKQRTNLRNKLSPIQWVKIFSTTVLNNDRSCHNSTDLTGAANDAASALGTIPSDAGLPLLPGARHHTHWVLMQLLHVLLDWILVVSTHLTWSASLKQCSKNGAFSFSSFRYCYAALRDQTHYCPNCNQVIGQYHPDDDA